jgi:plasmid stabilization system protein ParE|tara:strand:+ start:59964 stop:60269 length:306 start_codon:yes stop_codon:yes gene_type:complete
VAREIVYRRRALSERIALLTGIALESPQGARAVEAAMDRSIDRVSVFPESAPLFDIDRPTLRILTIRRIAAVLYTFDSHRLIVLRVLYARQDLDAVRDSLS